MIASVKDTYFGAQFNGDPSPWSRRRVLFRLMRKFTLGHAMLLEWLESPFIAGGRWPGAADCALFTMVCTRGVWDAARLCRSRFVRWHLRRFMPMRFQLPAAIAQITRYLEEFSVYPKCWINEHGRTPGTPFLESVKVTHMAVFHRTEDEALNLPLSLAIHDYAAHRESLEKVKIVSDEEETAMAAARALAEEKAGAVRN